MPERFTWTPDLKIGIQELDVQHKLLFDNTKELFAAWDRGAPREELSLLIDRVSDDLRMHFATEERYIQSVLGEYDDFVQHLEDHTKFLTRSVDFLLKFHQGQEDLSKEMLEEILQWWLHHIENEDKELGICLRAQGYR